MTEAAATEPPTAGTTRVRKQGRDQDTRSLQSTAARLVPRGRRHRAQPRSPGEGGRHSDHYMTSLQDKQTEPIATVNLVELGKQAYQRQQINNGPSRSTFATGTEGLDTKQVGGSTERRQMPRRGGSQQPGRPSSLSS